MTRVAFLGLGVMGYPMAGHLKSAGYDVVVYNRTTAKSEAWVAEYGGEMATTPALAAEGADFVGAGLLCGLDMICHYLTLMLSNERGLLMANAPAAVAITLSRLS